jgi:RNA polymerase sigma-70 factor (ECF subfamily)
MSPPGRPKGEYRRAKPEATLMTAPPAFRQQLLAAIPRLRRYARSLVFDAQNADDLVQNTLERALAHWRQFDPRRDIVLWLLSIAHNAHLDALRRDRRLDVLPPERVTEVLDQQQARGSDAGLRLDLTAALERLSLDQRSALVLVLVEQLSYAEAAEVLQVPAGTVMSRVSRARVAMRQWLDGSAAAPASATPRPDLRRVV